MFSPLGDILDLSYCDGTEVSIESPIALPEDGMSIEEINKFSDMGIDVFNTSDTFFNDKCYPFTSEENKTDVTLEDRRTNYYQNISLCANGCTYKGVNINDLRVSCSCEFNSGDNNNKEELSIGKKVFSSFKGSINQNNYIVITCYKIVFDLDIIKNNIGFYVFLIFNLMQIINLIIFSIYSKIIFAKAFCSNPSINQKHNNSMISNDTISYASSTINLSKQKPNNNKEHRSAYHKYLDDMDYENAKKKDSRKVYSVIIWRSKHYHPFYIAFCEENEENIRNVAIGLLLIGIESDFAVGALFYSDKYISNSSNQGGTYDFIFSLYKILYSTALGIIVSYGCAIFAVTFNHKILSKDSQMISKTIITKKIQLCLFFLILMCFSFFYWYFVTAFCGVYQNSQINWLLDSLSSLALGLSFPFFTAIISTLGRFFAYRFNIEVLFYFSSLLEHM